MQMIDDRDRKILESLQADAGISVTELRAATLRHKAGLAARAEGVFGQWLHQITPANAMRLPKIKA